MEAVERHGYRPRPTPRDEEHRAIAAASQAFASATPRFSQSLPRGTLHARLLGTDTWRIALVNSAGERTVVGSASGDAVGLGMTRTVAEALRRAPAGAEAGRPQYRANVVGVRMRVRRNSRTPAARADGTVTLNVPGATLVIAPAELSAMTLTAGLRLVLEGPWTDVATARVADAMLRDLAPDARHLTYTTTPRGRYFNESGSILYDASSWALCSCGWSYPAGDRSSARSTASWHRQHPSLCHITEGDAE